MDISHLINRSNVTMSLAAQTKEEVIHELSEMMLANGTISSLKAFIEDVYIREGIGETGMGNGIAIPHGKSDAVARAGIAVGRTEKAIEWESLDGKPCRLFFLLAVPKSDQDNTHIKMLSQLASILAYETIQDDLMSSQDDEDFINKFNQHYKEYIQKNQ